jgi:hypothetical protein
MSYEVFVEIIPPDSDDQWEDVHMPVSVGSFDSLEDAQSLAGDIEDFAAGNEELDIATHILSFMERTWSKQGVIGRDAMLEGYSEVAAIECALCELLDHARAKGCTVRVFGEDDNIRDVVVDPPEAEAQS